MKILNKLVLSILIITASLSAGADMTLTTLKGKTIHIVETPKGFTIPEYKGKIMFVEFWGTNCPPCRMSIPHYIELQNKYKDDLAILATEVQLMPADKLKKFVANEGINYDIVSHEAGSRFVNYITQRAAWKGSIPLLLILDQEGVVQVVQPGLIPQEALEKIIKDMIKNNPTKKSDNNTTVS